MIQPYQKKLVMQDSTELVEWMNRRSFFAKLLVGIAALPIIGKLCAKPESHEAHFNYGEIMPKDSTAPWLNTADGKWYVSNGHGYEELKLSAEDQAAIDARVDVWAREIVAKYLPPSK